MTQIIYRHGDCLIVKVDRIPTTWISKKENTVLLEWETTGHAHRLNGGSVMVCDEEPTARNNYLMGYFTITSPTPLTHEEHWTITIPNWEYAYYCQREYDPLEERRVLD